MRPDEFLVQIVPMIRNIVSGEGEAEILVLASCACRLVMRGWAERFNAPTSPSDLYGVLDALSREATARWENAVGDDSETALLKKIHGSVKRAKFALSEARIPRPRRPVAELVRAS